MTTDYEAFLAAEARLTARRAATEKPSISAAVLELPNMANLECVEDQGWCPLCADTGWIVRNDRGAGAAKRCECKIPHYDGPASVPAADLEARGCARTIAGELKETWDPRLGKWPAAADKWPADYRVESDSSPRPVRPKWLLIHGAVGNGKSRVATWIMRRAMARGGRTCRWIDIPAAIEEARNAIGSDDAQRTFRTKMAAKLACHLVILDDIAARDDSAYQVEDLLAAWVRTRYESGGWTVAVSNLSPAELRDLHPRSASRICSGALENMTGGDARRKEWRAA